MSDAAPPAPAQTETPADPPANPGHVPALINGDPPAADKPADPAPPAEPEKPAAPVVPEAYEFTPPEIDGKPVAVDEAALDAFKAQAKELGLTQEQFAGVTAAGMEKIAALAQAPYEAWRTQQSAWQDEIKADPEIGGDKLAVSLAAGAKAVEAFGGAALKQALEVTGAGNNPAIVKAFVAIGKAMGDADGLLIGKPAAGVKPISAEQAARNIYGTYPEIGAA